MTRRGDQLDRIEAAVARLEDAATRIEDALNPATPGGVAVAAADAKAARSSAEAAFACTQALASVATAKPGLGELAGAVATNTEAVRQVHQMVAASARPAVSMPAPPASVSVPPPAGTAKGTKGGAS